MAPWPGSAPCGSGVPPWQLAPYSEVARGLDLTSAATDIVPAFLDSDLYATMAP